jgi:hypothetical protein
MYLECSRNQQSVYKDSLPSCSDSSSSNSPFDLCLPAIFSPAPYTMTDCTVQNGKLYYKDRVYAPPDDELCTQLIYCAHNTGLAGHPSQVKTVDLITRSWWWPAMSRDIEQYVRACNQCVQTRASHLAPQGFLKPLPLPY